MNTEEIKKELSKEGFDNIYVWDAVPFEDDPNHTHDFDTKLHVISGSIDIVMDDKKITLNSGDGVYVPRNKVHSGLVGENGCKYIVAERH